jgi:hypothetical protein
MSATWGDFSREAPELAAFVRGRIEEHGLAILATLRADGSPRVSGLEPFFHDGELWFGMMPASIKAADLRRDGRFALHNATVDKDVTDGDVKVNGIASLAEPGGSGLPQIGQDAELFTTTITSVSAIRVVDGRLLIDTWRPGGPATRRTRT